MVTENEKEIIVRCARKYEVSSVVLFGSSTEDEDANDIDVGVKGIEQKLFFKFYAELFKHLSRAVHLVDLSQKSLFNDIVEETGVRIYG
jgi:predicted nucleotidyltransferase